MKDAGGLATELLLYAVYEYEYVSVFVSVSVSGFVFAVVGDRTKCVMCTVPSYTRSLDFCKRLCGGLIIMKGDSRLSATHNDGQCTVALGGRSTCHRLKFCAVGQEVNRKPRPLYHRT